MEPESFQALRDVSRGMVRDTVDNFETVDQQTFDRDLELLMTSQSEQQEYALLWLEIEGLQDAVQQNHEIGEALTQQVIKILGSRLDPSLLMVRWDTSHFGLLIRDCPPAQALQIARVLRTVMQNTGFYRQGEVVYLGIHIGLVLFSQWGDKAELLAAANTACRAARKQGFNSIYVQRLG